MPGENGVMATATRSPHRTIMIYEKDNGYTVRIECREYSRELVFPSLGKMLRAIAAFMKADIPSPNINEDRMEMGMLPVARPVLNTAAGRQG